MGGFGPVPCESFLVGVSCDCVLVDGARSLSLLRAVLCAVVYIMVSKGMVWL